MLKRKDQIAGLFWLVISLFIIFKAIELGVGSFTNPGPGFVLCGASLLFAILSVLLILKSSFLNNGQMTVSITDKYRLWPNVIITVIILILFGTFLNKAGFLLTTFGFLLVLYLLGKFKFWTAISSAIVTVVISYAIFHFVLKVEFPRGLIEW